MHVESLKYFHPITHKKDAPEDKDPPEGKELSNLSGPYLSKVRYRACARFVGGAAFNRNVWQKPEEIVLCCTQNVV